MQTGMYQKVKQTHWPTQLNGTDEPIAGDQPGQSQRHQHRQTAHDKQKAPPLKRAEDQDPKKDPTYTSAGQTDQPATTSRKNPPADHQLQAAKVSTAVVESATSYSDSQAAPQVAAACAYGPLAHCGASVEKICCAESYRRDTVASLTALNVTAAGRHPLHDVTPILKSPP